MDIGKVLEKAFKYPWKNKSLWFYGVLIAIFSVGSSGSNYTPDDGDYTQLESYLNSFEIDWTIFWSVIAIVVFIGIIVGIIGLIISTWSQAAIIGGVRKLETNKKITKKEIGKTGKRTVWNLIVLNLFIPFGIFIGLVAVAVPIIAVIMVLPDPINITVGIIVGLLALFVLVPALIYFGIVWALAPCSVVLEKTKAIESIKNTRRLLKGRFWYTFLLLFVLSIINGMIMFFFVLPLFIFGGLTIYFWSNAIIASIIFGIITMIYIIFMVIVAGYFQAVVQTGVTVWWLDLVKTKKGIKKE